MELEDGNDIGNGKYPFVLGDSTNYRREINMKRGWTKKKEHTHRLVREEDKNGEIVDKIEPIEEQFSGQSASGDQKKLNLVSSI